MVQSATRFRICNEGRGHGGHFRPHGDPAPLRYDRTASRPVRAGAFRARPQGADGGRSSPRERTARSDVALNFPSMRIARMAAALPRIAAALLIVACSALATLAPAHAAGQGTLEIVSASGVHAFNVELATTEP